MKSIQIRSFLLISGAVLVADSAAAQSIGIWDSSFNKKFYIGAGAGASQLTPETTGTVFTVQDDADSAATLSLGVDFSRRLTFEFQYADLGRSGLVDLTGVQSEIGYTERSASVLYYLWNGFADDEYLDSDGLDLRAGLSLYGRLGAGQMENEAFGDVGFIRNNDVQVLGGLGIEYGFQSGLAARADYIRYDKDADYAGLSLLYRMGGRRSVELVEEPELPVLPAPTPISTLPPPPPPPPELEDLPSLPPLTEMEPDSTMNPDDLDSDGIENSVDACPDTAAGTPVNSNGCQIFNGVIEGVNFLSGSDTLTQVARDELDGVIQTLRDYPEISLSIEAHTDSRGAEDENLNLSRLRALSVVRYIISGGIDVNRLQARAYGEARPIADNTTSDGRLLNRRVEFRTL